MVSLRGSFVKFLYMVFCGVSSHDFCMISLHCFFVCEQKEVVYSMDQEKQSRVLTGMEQLKVTQMMITDPNALFYLTGKWIHPGERFLGLLLSKDHKPVLIVNELFSFPEDIGAVKQYFSDTDDLAPVWRKWINKDEKLGIDKTMPSGFLLKMMECGAASGYVLGSAAVDGARAVKNAAEQEKMRRSSRINDAAMQEFKKLIHKGVTELEVAEQMLGIYKSLGAEAYSFDPIVAFGANAADGHHMPDNTVLKEGDCVLLDVGCIADSYCSDMTRTYFYKREPDALQKEIYQLVRRANEEAEAMLKPGLPLCNIDKKARDIITEGGYGPMFTHRLGHFIGIEDHEAGDVSLANKNLTKAGNIFSIEPGIYVTGKAGVRIEDLVLITENGAEVLNHASKDIEVLG